MSDEWQAAGTHLSVVGDDAAASNPRWPGDIATCYADPAKAERDLGWKARRDLDNMMRDAWRWQSMNPNGYR